MIGKMERAKAIIRNTHNMERKWAAMGIWERCLDEREIKLKRVEMALLVRDIATTPKLRGINT